LGTYTPVIDRSRDGVSKLDDAKFRPSRYYRSTPDEQTTHARDAHRATTSIEEETNRNTP